jgi:hypothetical protein
VWRIVTHLADGIIDGDVCEQCGTDMAAYADELTLIDIAGTVENIPSSTPCDGCGNPANWIVSTGVEEYVWCDDCHATTAVQATLRTIAADEYGGEP